jgi:uncharacterized protein YegP (UPF0339 family)
MADEEQKDEFELEFYEDADASEDDRWGWKITSTGNHEVIVASDEGFASKSNAERNFRLVQRAMLTL